jgi:hypothetical protein
MRTDRDGGVTAGRLRGDRRGQTLQDFLLGVSLFLVTTMFVLSLLPGYLSPYTVGVGGDEEAQADRVAQTLVSNLSVAPDDPTLSTSTLDTVLAFEQDDLRERYALPPTARVSISVRTVPNGSVVRAGGAPLTNDLNRTSGSVASASRLVELRGTSCDPVCRLVVEVW